MGKSYREKRQKEMETIPHTHYFIRKKVSQRGYIYYCTTCGKKHISKDYRAPIMIVKEWEEAKV